MAWSQDAKSLCLKDVWKVAVIGIFGWLAAMLSPAAAEAAGFVHNDNFVIFTPPVPSQEAADLYAKAVLKRAEQLRKQIALEWLGEELPPSIGQVLINVSFPDEPNSGLTWAKDHPDRQMHMVFLVTAPEQLPDCLLAHEMVHCVLATKYPHPERLPAWLEEGIASRYDDVQRKAERQQIVRWIVSNNQWPQLSKVLTAERVHSDNREVYTVAVTVTDLLLERGDKPTLLRFGQLVGKEGLDRALAQCYGIANAAELERLWRSRLARQQ